MRIHFAFCVNVLSIPEVISSGIDGVSSLICITLVSIFRILIIGFIGSSMCPIMKIQKNIIGEATGQYSMFIPWQVKQIQICWWVKQWHGGIGVK